MSTEKVALGDPRNDYQKMSRYEVWAALDKAEIKYAPACTHEDGVKLLQANQVNPRDVMEWESVRLKNEKGDIVTQDYPKRTMSTMNPAEEERRSQVMAKLLEDAASKEEGSKNEIGELKEQVAALTKALQGMTESRGELRQVAQEQAVKLKETDPLNMKYMAQKKWLNEHGITIKKGDDVKSMIASVLEKENVEDPSDGS